MKLLGIRPVFRKNGANPVLSDLAELIANSMAGIFDTQSFCPGCTHWRIIWVIVRFARSVEPSDSVGVVRARHEELGSYEFIQMFPKSRREEYVSVAYNTFR